MDWIQAVVIPALVAAVVTVAVEYIAKPRLDARKERILSESQARRELFAVLRMAILNVHMLVTYRGPTWNTDPESREAARLEAQRVKGEIGEQAMSLIRLATAVEPLGRTGILFEVVTMTAAMLRDIHRTGLTHLTEDDVEEGVVLAIGLLQHPRATPTGREFRRAGRVWVDKHRSDNGDTP